MSEIESEIESVVGDPELITRARVGDREAFGELYRRHVQAATNLARQYARGTAADDLVAEAFARVLDGLNAGRGPDVAFRAYLFTTVRNTAYDRTRKDSRLTFTDDDRAIDVTSTDVDTVLRDTEDSLVGAAYQALPERWQAVLWYLTVEGYSPAATGELLGLSPNAVTSLAYRAREGLRESYLQAHLSRTEPERCRAVVGDLGAWTRDGLSRRERTVIDEHLAACDDCRALAAELAEVNSGMRALLAPVLLGGAALGYLALLGPATSIAKVGLLTGVAGGGGDSGSGSTPGSSGTGGGSGAGVAAGAVAGAAAVGAAVAGGPLGLLTRVPKAWAIGAGAAAAAAAVVTAVVISLVSGSDGPGSVADGSPGAASTAAAVAGASNAPGATEGPGRPGAQGGSGAPGGPGASGGPGDTGGLGAFGGPGASGGSDTAGVPGAGGADDPNGSVGSTNTGQPTGTGLFPGNTVSLPFPGLPPGGTGAPLNGDTGANDPNANGPNGANPGGTGPGGTNPGGTGPGSGSTNPNGTGSTNANGTGPGGINPAPTDPGGPGPAPTNPAPTDLGGPGSAPTNPAPTNPAPTDPAPTNPAPTNPAPTDSGTVTPPVPTGPPLPPDPPGTSVSFPNGDPVVSAFDLNADTLTVRLRVEVAADIVANGQAVAVPAGVVLQSLEVTPAGGALRGTRALTAPASVDCATSGATQTCAMPQLMGTVEVTFVFGIGDRNEFALRWSGGAAVNWKIPVPDRGVTLVADTALAELPAGVSTAVALRVTPKADTAGLHQISVPKESAGYTASGCQSTPNSSALICAVTQDGTAYVTSGLTLVPHQRDGTGPATLKIRYGSRSQSVDLTVVPLVASVQDRILAGAGTLVTVEAGWETDAAVVAPGAISLPTKALDGTVTVTGGPKCPPAKIAGMVSCPAVPNDASHYTAVFMVSATGAVPDDAQLEASFGTATSPVAPTVVRPTVSVSAATIPAGRSARVTVDARWASEQTVINPGGLTVEIPSSADGLTLACVGGKTTTDCPATLTDGVVSAAFTARAADTAAGATVLPVSFGGVEQNAELTIAGSSVLINASSKPTAGGYAELTIGGGWADLTGVPFVGGTVSVPQEVGGVRLVATGDGCTTTGDTVKCPVDALTRGGSVFGATVGVAPSAGATSVSVPITLQDAAGVVARGEQTLTIGGRAADDPLKLTGAVKTDMTGARLGIPCVVGEAAGVNNPTACLSLQKDARIVWAQLSWSSSDTVPVTDVALTAAGTTVPTGDPIAGPTLAAGAVAGSIPITPRTATVDVAALDRALRASGGVISAGAPGQVGGWTLVVAWTAPGNPISTVSLDDSYRRLVGNQQLAIAVDTRMFLYDFDAPDGDGNPKTSDLLGWLIDDRPGGAKPGQLAAVLGARVYAVGPATLVACSQRAGVCSRVAAAVTQGLVVGPRLLPPTRIGPS